MTKTLSIYLDIFRFLAASIVFVVHADYGRLTGGLPFFWRFKDLGNDAVMVFFVLSGYVITWVADQKESLLKDFYASRLARLYSVVIPALILTVSLDFIGSSINFDLYSDSKYFQSDTPLWRIFANLFFINELWFLSVRPFSNGPFWSLGYEFWYYVIFSFAWYFKKPLRNILIIICCFFVGPKILILFPVWLLGVCAYFITKQNLFPKSIGLILYLSSTIAYIAFRQGSYPQILTEWTINHFGKTFVIDQLKSSQYFLSSYVIGLLIALHFIGVASIAPLISRFLAFFERPIRYLAEYTFAIYLFHYPLLQFIAAISSKVSPPPTNSSGNCSIWNSNHHFYYWLYN